MKTTIIIQARMSSSRFPGKILKTIQDIPIIELIIKRLKKSKLVDDILVATSNIKENKLLINLLKKKKIKFFCGSEHDALSRFYYAAKKNKSRIIVRITGDCPLADPKIVDEFVEGIPIMGSVAAGGLIETYNEVNENLDISYVLGKKDIFALTVNGDSMIDACIAHGDMVLMEPVNDSFSLKNGTIVSAMVPGLGTTLKYFIRRGSQIVLEAANPSYEPIVIENDQVSIQGKLLAVWRKV